jgi:hypothetical protein
LLKPANLFTKLQAKRKLLHKLRQPKSKRASPAQEPISKSAKTNEQAANSEQSHSLLALII